MEMGMTRKRGAWALGISVTLALGLALTTTAQDAEMDPSTPHGVSGSFTWAGVYDQGQRSEDGLSVRGIGYEVRTWADDPRLVGPTRIVLNHDKLGPRPYSEQYSGSIRIDNVDGAWVGTLRGYFDPASKVKHFDIELSGLGGYAGSAAVLQTIGSSDRDFAGFVFPVGLLAYPDPVEAPVE